MRNIFNFSYKLSGNIPKHFEDIRRPRMLQLIQACCRSFLKVGLLTSLVYMELLNQIMTVCVYLQDGE